MDAESPVQCAVYAPEPTKEDLCIQEGHMSAAQHRPAASGPAIETRQVMTLWHSVCQYNEGCSVGRN